MNTCPNPNSPEWKALVAALGEGDAMTAYSENGNNIPSVEEAKNILSTMKVLEKDEQLSRSSDAFKLQRAREQMTNLDTMLFRAKPKQKATLEALKAMNLRYQEFLRNNIKLMSEGKPTIKTVSVSNLIGSSEFKGDPKEYEAFKLFGTFMHEALELGQVEALRSAKNIDQVMTREFFNEKLDEYRKKNPFYIENLDEDVMYDMAMRIAQHVSINNDRGFMILPEITVTGDTKDGTMVVGRLDLMLIDTQGRINIFDFKTKKVTRMMEQDPATGQPVPNEDIVFVDLAEKRFPVDPKKGTADAFKGDQRTTYDTWTLQLKVYENILKQNGMDVRDQSILAMLYQTDKEKKFVGHAIHIFDEDNFYNYAAGADVPNNNGFWVTEPTIATKRIEGLREIIDQEIPTPESRARQKEEVKKEVKALDFQPTEEQDDSLKKLLQDAVAQELNNVLGEIRKQKEKNDNPQLLEILTARRETLRRFQDILEKVKGNDPMLTYSTNFSAALDAVYTDFQELRNVVRTAMETFKFDGTSFSSKEGVQVIEAYRRMQALANTAQVLKKIAVDANAISEDPLAPESETRKRLTEIDFAQNEITSNFARITLYDAVQVLKTPGEETFKAITKEGREILETKIKHLEEKMKKLEGSNAPVVRSLKGMALSFIDKNFKRKLAEQYGEEGGLAMTQMEQIQREIDKTRALLEGGLNFSDEALERYISGITDPSSDMYIGNSNVFNPDSMLNSLPLLNRVVASASNAELGISAFTQMLKNAQAKAVLNIQNSFAAQDFDKKRDALLKRMSLEQLNDKISEERTIQTIDRNTGDIIEKSLMYYAKPFSQEYENTWRGFSIARKQLEIAIATAKAERNEKFGTPEGPAAEQKYLDLIKQKQDKNQEYIQWMLDNCQLPYDERFYKLQLGMPEEIRDELQLKYLEMETITYQVGKGNEVLLSEEDFERLKEIEDEIRVLRKKAKELNPDYARYIDQMNELYEFDTNFAFYERMRNNAKDRFQVEFPDKWEQWKRDNEVVRPTKRPELPENLERGQNVFYNGNLYFVLEDRGASVKIAPLYNEEGAEEQVVLRKDLQSLSWYEELNQLYEERAMFFGSDPEISELMEERRSILAPHKDGGRLQPQFLNDEEIRRLDEIEAELEELMGQGENPKPRPKLDFSPDEIEAIKRISQELNKLKKKEISQAYLDTFNSKHKALQRAYREMIDAQSAAAKAETTGDQKAIDEAVAAEQFATAAFATYEKEFAEWYNKFHNNKYKSILTGWNPASEKDPKLFNYENVPSDAVRDQYMETVPHPKYKIKRLKESAYNPEFQKSPDGIPMPKAIITNSQGHYVIRPGFETSPNVNQKYKEMMKDAEVFSFYNDMMGMFFDLQKKVEGRKLGYQMPGIAASAMENIARKGLNGAIKGEWEKFLDQSVRREGKIDRVENTFGELGGKIRHRFSEQLDPSLQSKDAVGAIIKYATEAHFNIAMQEAAPKADAFIEHLEYIRGNMAKDLKNNQVYQKTDPVTGAKTVVDMNLRLKQLDEVISILKFERRKFVEGATEDPNVANKVLTKRVNAFFAYTSFIRIGFDVANQAKNYVSGNVQAFIAAGGLASDQYTRADYMWAKKKIYGPNGFLSNYFKDWGRLSDVSDTTMLYRFFNPAQKDFLQYTQEIAGGKKRQAASKMTSIQELGFMLQDKGDTEIALTVMYSVMNHRRFRVFEIDTNGDKVYKKDDKGNDVTVPVHEIYYKNTKGELARRADVEYTEDDENRIRNIIYSEMRRAQGNYAKSDMTAFEQTIFGKMVFFFRKYLIPQLVNRFGYMRPNWEAAEVAMGYWRAVAQAVKYYGPGQVAQHMLMGSKMMSKFNKNQMGDFYTRKVSQARRDAIAMAVLTMMGMMALAYVRGKDDDDEELGVLEGNAIRILWGVKGETTSMFPVGGGSQEYIRNFTTAVPLVREFTAAQKLLSHSWNYTLAMAMNGGDEPDPGYDSEYYQDIWKDAFYARKSGAYEKGDAKIVKDLVDLTGIKNFRDLLDPNNRIDQLKRNQ